MSPKEETHLFVVNLCIDSSITNEIDDPFLALVLAQSESRREIPGIHISMQIERGGL